MVSVAVSGLFRIGEEFLHEAEMLGEKTASAPGVAGRLCHVGGEPLFVEDVVEVFEFCLGKVEILIVWADEMVRRVLELGTPRQRTRSAAMSGLHLSVPFAGTIEIGDGATSVAKACSVAVELGSAAVATGAAVGGAAMSRAPPG